VDKPPNSGAEAAYDRALVAYQEKSYEVARRWVLEALAHNRQHSGARALLGRLDAARAAASPFQAGASGSEVISTDPTVLISRASGSAIIPEPIDPTVMVSRDDPRRRPADTDPRVVLPPFRPPRSNDRPVSEPTIIAPSKQRAASSRPKSSFSVIAALQSLGERLQPGGSRPVRSSTGRPGQSTGDWLSTPAARGALLAVATVAVGALLVWGLFLAVRWFWPAGQLLTITKPVGGTIVGPGIECGTHGSRCSTSITTGKPIELGTEPDKDYVWSGYTGDCAPAGRTSMTGPRTCGATFGRLGANSAPVTFRLTITKPEGGTVVGAGGILCGTNGSTCTADIPSGVPVSLKGESDDGYSWQQFTGDCPSTGEMTMTSAKSCGVTFIKTAGPAINVGPGRVPGPIVPSRRPGPPPPLPVSPQPQVNPSSQPAAVPTNPAGSQGPTPTPSTQAPTVPDKPAAGPKSADDHARDEIGLLVKNYCTALDTLKPATIRGLFHLDNERELKEKFKEYKSLKCTVTSPPEYDRLDSREAGAAQLKFGMKQVIKMGSGGAPATIETIVTMVVSRKDFQSPWLIDRVFHEEKPK
jgi:hypothetical protein